MHNFAPGSNWNIVYKDDSFNGFTFKVIEKFNPGGAPSMGPGGMNPAPQQQYVAPPLYAPNPPQNFVPKEDPLPERIFVYGAMNAVLSNPTVNPTALTEDQLVVLVNGFRRAFARTFGGRREDATAPLQNPQQNAEMSDEIPF
jgi:hypothetical protein